MNSTEGFSLLQTSFVSSSPQGDGRHEVSPVAPTGSQLAHLAVKKFASSCFECDK